MQNAAQYQYGTPTPPPRGDLPMTGSTLVPWLLLAGVVLVAAGNLLRGLLGRAR